MHRFPLLIFVWLYSLLGSPLSAQAGEAEALPDAASLQTDKTSSERESSSVADPVIYVYGRRLESISSRTTGQSILVRPEDASRFESISHLKRESSVIAPETSRISPSGFVVPKVRGQDSKLTDVYLDDIQLQDPYSGLPLIEDLDLRAFGAMELHQGLPPPDVPGLNLIGTLRYLFLVPHASSVTAGITEGRPFGHGVWGLGLFSRQDPGMQGRIAGRVYGRAHQTDGRFPYYSDNSTPYNISDDRTLIRENNDQRSEQFVPYLDMQRGPYRLRLLGWAYHAARGLPSMSAVIPSATRETARGNLAHVRLSRVLAFPSESYPLTLTLGASLASDDRFTTDPGRRFLGAAERGHLRVWSHRGHAQVRSEWPYGTILITGDKVDAAIRNQLDRRTATALSRHTDTATLGVAVSPLDFIRIETKGTLRSQSDTQDAAQSVLSLPGEPTLADKHAFARGAGGSLAVGSQERAVYVQIARAKRLPSLIEEFGDGASLRPSTTLRPESIWHREVGFFAKSSFYDGRLGMAAYQDDTDDKIVFVPILANASKALNVAQTRIQGLDARAEIQIDKTRFFVSTSRIFPYDLSRTQKRLLPGVAERVVTGEVTHDIGAAALRWLSRYRSDVYRDLSNTVRLPGAVVHDASVDYRFSPQLVSSLKVGISVKNIFDMRSVAISAPDTPGSAGQTAFSDVMGAPLPGRSWMLSLAATL